MDKDHVFIVDLEWGMLGARAADIAVRLGYEKGKAPEPFAGMIARVLAEAPRRLALRAGYRLVSAGRPADRRDGLVLDGVFFTTGAVIASELARADEAAVFACTIGDGLEEWAAALMREGEPATGFIVDAAASSFAERAAAVLHDRIASDMNLRGRSVTNRYSPGYCTWDVAEQRLLFSLLPDGFCGIRLNDSALMTPVKSVSGIIGVGKSVRRRDYRCGRCGVAECTWRATRGGRNGH